jgi:hypothetical protein
MIRKAASGRIASNAAASPISGPVSRAGIQLARSSIRADAQPNF